MKTIYKYRIDPFTHSLRLPSGSRALCVQTQRDVIFLWAEIEPEYFAIERDIYVYGTGQPIHPMDGSKSQYVGTVQLEGDESVLHVYIGNE